jgi:hypothetical protein
MEKGLKSLRDRLDFLEFSLSNTVDPINVIHIEGQMKEVKNKIEKIKKNNKMGGLKDKHKEKKVEKSEPKEQTMADSSGSFESPMSAPITKRKIYQQHNSKKYGKQQDVDEVTDASSSGSFDVPFGGGTKGRKDPLKIDGVKSIANCMAVKKKNFPKWGGPGGTFIKIKEKCKKFPYCNQGDINAIEPLREAIAETAKEYGLSIGEVENLVLNEIKRIFI